MKRYFDNYQDENGDAIQGATVTVYKPNGELATLYSDNANPPTPLANPVITDALGYYSFYAPNGRYDLVLVHQGYDTLRLKDVDISDLQASQQDLSTLVTAAVNAYFAAHPANQTPGPAGKGVPPGGTSGQILSKLSNNDYDTTWINQVAANADRPVVVLAPDAQGKVLIDAAKSNNFQLLLTRDVTFLDPINVTATTRLHIILQQDAVGGHKIAFSPDFFVIGGVPNFDTTPNLVNRMDLDKMADGVDWVVTPFFLSTLGSNTGGNTGGGTPGTVVSVTDTLLASYPWETAGSTPAVVTDTKLDATTMANYLAAANSAQLGSKRTAGANSIVTDMGSAYRMTLQQGGNARAVISYNSPIQVANVNGDIVLSMGSVASITGFNAGAIANGVWTAQIANAAGRTITVTLGPVSGTQQFHLSGDIALGIGIRPESVTLTMPRPLDGLV